MRNKIIGYDNVCGLAAAAKNPCRSSFSEEAKLLAQLKFVHDRMHIAGHTNELCRIHYNLENLPDTKTWSSECAEQEFTEFSQHKKLFHHTSRGRSAIWVALIFHENNLLNDSNVPKRSTTP